jgi:SAM-dependent methyltransferase
VTAPADDTRDRLVRAVNSGRIAEVAEVVAVDPRAPADDRLVAVDAIAACERIGASLAAERDRVVELLGAAGVAATSPVADRRAQRHELVLAVDPDDLVVALDVLELDGHRSQHRPRDGALRSFVRNSSEVTLARSDDVTTVIRLRWREPRRPTGLARAFRPTVADWDLVTLPTWAWWGYRIIRPTRLLLERAGLRNPGHADLEPFLVTPSDLVDPLLDVADVGPADTVLDVGCGDGRIVVRAATRHRCRAIGVEQSTVLVERARERVRSAGVAELVRIVEGDALSPTVAGLLREATVVVLFLPMRVALRVVPALLRQLPPGSRVLLHEQSPLDRRLPPPERSVPVVGHESLTVAHRWVVTSAAR